MQGCRKEFFNGMLHKGSNCSDLSPDTLGKKMSKRSPPPFPTPIVRQNQVSVLSFHSNREKRLGGGRLGE